LVLLHGGTASIEFESLEIQFFATEFQVIAVEQMGHGRTADAMDREFHYHDMAEDTVELMRQLEIESAFVHGLSDGGVVGIDMAIHHPACVRRLSVSGANIRPDGLIEGFLGWFATAKPEDWSPEVRESYERLSPDGPGHWPVVFNRITRMWLVEPDYTEEQIAGITAPTLVIVGDRDLVTAEHAVEMFRAIPDAQLCVIPNAGHGVVPRDTILKFFNEPVASL